LPYLCAEDRNHLDREIDALASKMNDLGTGFGADMNYCIHCLIAKAHPQRYAHWQEIIGALECAKQELYRRIAIYENAKAQENGDIPGLPPLVG
jgi:hypothetical protein